MIAEDDEIGKCQWFSDLEKSGIELNNTLTHLNAELFFYEQYVGLFCFCSTRSVCVKHLVKGNAYNSLFVSLESL